MSALEVNISSLQKTKYVVFCSLLAVAVLSFATFLILRSPNESLSYSCIKKSKSTNQQDGENFLIPKIIKALFVACAGTVFAFFVLAAHGARVGFLENKWGDIVFTLIAAIVMAAMTILPLVPGTLQEIKEDCCGCFFCRRGA